MQLRAPVVMWTIPQRERLFPTLLLTLVVHVRDHVYVQNRREYHWKTGHSCKAYLMIMVNVKIGFMLSWKVNR